MRCHYLDENPWVQVLGLWVLTPIGIKISLEKAVVASLLLALFLDIFVVQQCLFSKSAPSSL